MTKASLLQYRANFVRSYRYSVGLQIFIRPSIFVVVDLVWFVCFPSLMLGSIRVFSCKHFKKLQHLNLTMWCYREPSRSTLFLCSLLSSFTWCITKLSVDLVKFGYASDDWHYSEWQKCLLSHCITVYLWIISGDKRKKKNFKKAACKIFLPTFVLGLWDISK